MSTISNAEIEGRLMAQRHAIARLIAHVAPASEDDRWLNQNFPDNPIPQDGQEDPGAVPDAAFAIEAARADELRLIAVEARRRLKAVKTP